MPRRKETTEFEKKLIAEGRWPEAQARMRQLKDQGVDGRAIWSTLRGEFSGPRDITTPIFSAGPGLERVDFRETVTWVFNALAIKNVTAADAPSPGAWGLLQHARSSEGARAEFYSTFAAKMLPSRQQLEKEQKRHDDGGELEVAIEACLRAREAAVLPPGPQGSRAEPPVPAGVGTGGSSGSEGGP